MPRGRASSDPAMLAMALVGYEIEKQKIEEKIREIRARLSGGKTPARAAAPAKANAGGPRRKRTLSAAARQRIAAAQRKRWAAHRKKLAQGGKGK